MSLSLSLLIAIAGALSVRCTTDPNPKKAASNNENNNENDRIRLLTRSVPTVIRRVASLIIAHHVLLTLFWRGIREQDEHHHHRYSRYICPYGANLNEALFSWTWTSGVALLAIFVGAAVRLSAFHRLGSNFTFHLTAPDRLVTTGVYRFIQHPGYTGQFLVCGGCIGLLLRWDGTPACWMGNDNTLLQLLRVPFFRDAVLGSLAVFFVSMVWLRVVD
ncbi:hypothetical protein ASPZODRAFT_126597, partial [Penicilliopsis zonata CBS 506.65]